MKRIHIHASVDNIAQSTDFYSTLFGSDPTVTRSDYAKWQLDDPRLNFAISARGMKPGIDHLGIQTESTEELHSLLGRLSNAELASTETTTEACCYAESQKSWIQDPAGIAWEAFHTLHEVQYYHGTDNGSSCCSTSDCC